MCACILLSCHNTCSVFFCCCIRFGDEIGSGHFGVVHHGVWNHIGKTDQVAIKTLRDEVSEGGKTKLLREAATVQQFLHINIIKFYGVITSRERVRNQ